MLPPTEFDVCEYHLQAPKEFYQRGEIAFLPHNVYANMALGAEMLSLLGMTIVRDWWWGALVGKTVIAAFTPLCALGLLAAGRRFYSTSCRRGRGPGLHLDPLVDQHLLLSQRQRLVVGHDRRGIRLLPVPGVVRPAAIARQRTDSLQQLPNAPPLQWGGFSRDAELPESHPMPLVALAGYLAGGAVATKYPAVLFVLIPMAIWTLVGRSWRKESRMDRRSAARDLPEVEPLTPTPPLLNPEPRHLNPLAALAVFLLAAALGCGLWFGKNWALTGNPTYPLMYGVFDGATWNADKEMRWNRAHCPHDFAIETLGKDLGSVLMTSEWISPLVVPLALLAFLGWADKPVVIWRRLRWELLVYVVFVIAVWWLFTHRIDRFWIPVLPVMALLAGAGACWSFRDLVARRSERLLLAALGANFLLSSAGPGNAWFVPLGQLRNDPVWIDPCHYYLNNDADRGTVLAVGDAAVFDLKPRVLYNTCFDDCVFEQLVKGKTAKEIRAEFASLQIAYVYVNWQEIQRYRDSYGFTDFVQPEVFDRLLKEGILELIPQTDRPSESIYRVKL